MIVSGSQLLIHVSYPLLFSEEKTGVQVSEEDGAQGDAGTDQKVQNVQKQLEGTHLDEVDAIPFNAPELEKTHERADVLMGFATVPGDYPFYLPRQRSRS